MLQGQGVVVGIEGLLIPPMAEVNASLIVWMLCVAVPGVAVPAPVVEVVVALEQPMVLEHPIIVRTDEGPQYGGE